MADELMIDPANIPLAKQMDEGVVTTYGVGLTITDAAKRLSVNCYSGYGLRIISGTSKGAVRTIVSNTADAYTVDAAVVTDLDSRYIIFVLPSTATLGVLNGIPKEAGTASAIGAGVATITDAAKLWMVNQWVGFGYRIYAGTGIGLAGRILSNTLNVLTVDRAITTGVDSRYVIVDMPLESAAGVPVTSIDQTTPGTTNNVAIASPTVVRNNHVAVAVPGTEVQLSAASVPIKKVAIKADPVNTGNIYVGGAGVGAADGYILESGDSVEIIIDNLNAVWIDADVAGEEVSYIAT